MSYLQIDKDSGDIGGGGLARRKTLDNYTFMKAKEELLRKAHNSVRVITQLASFVPDFILLNKSIYQISEKLTGVSFMADVSGFTALTEAYSLKGKGGTDQLTKTLSSYMGPLAECILFAGGDIIKYAGDAFLAIWRINDPATTYQIIQKAADCALYIQEKYGTYETEIGIKIRVKIGIGIGELFQLSLDSDKHEYHHFVCFGRGVQSAAQAEGKCVPGDVILGPNAWRNCDPSHFIFSMKEDGFAKITDIVTFQRQDQRGRPIKGARARAEEDLRPTIMYAVRNSGERKLEESLRTFVIPPVIRKIDDEIPLEYLNESRQTSVCFIKVDCSKHFTESSRFLDSMGDLVKKCFKQVYNSTSITNGCLTKVIMFDKGLTYLVVFGLPGYIHDNQSANAIKFSFKVKSVLHEVDEHITEVSIGVTSGTTYCGILGHKKRQEYTVIGRIVNKAARLMCNYPNRVTCDQDTLYHSKLPVNQFSLMEAKELKGIKNAGNIYEYVGSEIGEEQGIKHYEYPLVNRETESKHFQVLLETTEAECTRFLKVHRVAGAEVEYSLNKEVQASGYWVLVLEGDIGVGKSRLLSSFIEQAQEKKGVEVFSITMNLISGSQSLFAIRSLLYQALNFDDMRSSNEREDHLRKLAGSDAELLSGLCLLNDVMNVKFPIHPRYVDVDIGTRRSYSQHIASVLVRMAFPKSLTIFVVDDAHYMDAYSWEFIVYLSRTPTTFALLSIRRSSSGLPKLSDPVNQIIYHHKHVKSIRLTGLEPDHCLPLACQLAEVNAIPVDLEKILKGKSRGNPAWIEQVLKEWLRTGLLRTLPFDLREATKRKMDMAVLEKKEYIEKKTKNKNARRITAIPDEMESSINIITQAQRLRQEAINAENRMIVIKSDTNIVSMKALPGSLREILLDAFDELDSNQQMIIKCASVLGIKFSRTMMTKILPSYEKSYEKYEKSFHNLMFTQVLQCASTPTKDTRSNKDASGIHCYCKFSASEIEDNKKKDEKMNWNNTSKTSEPQMKQIVKALTFKERPAFHHCKFLKFTKDNMQEVVYELMTEDQRKEFHVKAAKYLENASGKCSVHGGEDTSYEFGFIFKGNDIAAEQEEALMTINASMNRRLSLFQESRSKETDFRHFNSEMSHSKVGGLSKVNAYNKIREVYQNNGARIGDMELDIFEELEKFESDNQKYKWIKGICSCRGNDEVNQEKEYDEKLLELKNTAKELEVASTLTRSRASSTVSRIHVDDKSEIDSDLRGCYCVQVHARISAELVKHYQKAEKYGKCLLHLLDAAEAATSAGQVSQTIVHLEDVDHLLKALKNNELPKPKKNDKDDWIINIEEVDLQLDFLKGISYFELGVQSKALEFFMRCASNYGLHIPTEKIARNALTRKVSAQLWRRHHCSCTTPIKNIPSKKSNIMIFRILNHLRTLFQNSLKPEMALLVCLKYARIAEDCGTFDDVLSAFAAVMESYSYLGLQKKAKSYEKLAIKYIRKKFISSNQKDLIGLHTSSNVFITVAFMRLWRGDINRSIDAGYIALRISQDILHNNTTTITVYPRLIFGLMLSLRISEVVDALRKFWYAAEEEEDWGSFAKYYVISMTLMINTTFCMEQFFSCESFVNNSDWDADVQMFRIFDAQYNIEGSITLRYIRHSKWTSGLKWMFRAEKHRPKQNTLMSVEGDLKLLEASLITASHYLKTKQYQLSAKYREKAKSYIKLIEKGVELLPVFKPRQQHLIGYYYQILGRKSETKKRLKKAEKFAKAHGNALELEWISHSRAVWADKVVPSVRYFWIEHTERNTVDWHEASRTECKNIMYSLPLPTWK